MGKDDWGMEESVVWIACRSEERSSAVTSGTKDWSQHDSKGTGDRYAPSGVSLISGSAAADVMLGPASTFADCAGPCSPSPSSSDSGGSGASSFSPSTASFAVSPLTSLP